MRLRSHPLTHRCSLPPLPVQMTALMGPSGSGKTTLLDLLAGRKNTGTISGAIKYGGLTATPAFLQRYTAYVEQTDTLIPSMTVYEMLMVRAATRGRVPGRLCPACGRVCAAPARLPLLTHHPPPRPPPAPVCSTPPS